MRKINKLRSVEENKHFLGQKPYKALNTIIILIYGLFILIYLTRASLYKLNNQYLTLFAGTAPNLLPSFLFTLIGVFYIVPYFKGVASINRPLYIWL